MSLVYPPVVDNFSDLHEMALPFTSTGRGGEFFQPVRAARNLSNINYAMVETWKAIRICQNKVKSTPHNLSMLPTMPLDVLLEIIGHLHPIDLIHVSCTSKDFHELLRSPVTDSPWRNSFLAEYQLPECPPQVSGRRWAKLLFGPRICDECGGPGVDPDYILCRRACIHCLHKNLRDSTDNPELDDTVNRTQWWGDGRHMFWESDGTAVAAMYAAHRHEGGTDAAHRFIESQEVQVTENRERAVRCQDWDLRARKNSEAEYLGKLSRVTKSIHKRLVSEGFEKCDVKRVRYRKVCPNLWRMPRLTSKLWNRVRPYILPHVLQVQTERLVLEREARVRRRKADILATALRVLCAPVPGSRYLFHPPPRTIETFPPLAELIAEHSEEPLSPNDPRLAAALAGAPAFIEASYVQLQTLLMQLLPGADTAELDRSRLERATTIFSLLDVHGYLRTAIAWDEARAHLHWRSDDVASSLTGTNEFSQRGASTAARLAVLIGKQPDTVTAAEMDLADARFVCTTCSPTPKRFRRPALQWRESVLHDLRHATHKIPSWRALSPLATADVRRREQPICYSEHSTWFCILCTESHWSPTHRWIKQHIIDRHDIAHPVAGMHLAALVQTKRPWRQHVILAAGGRHPERYRCWRCANDHPEVVRLLAMRAILSHLVYKHSVAAPGADDWIETDLTMEASDEAASAAL
ncbi:hypothetical protein DFH06DRAFT_1216240 [Mycena polygramma]|nr:hypothetical protein DFH06DRAFT_1216240 [Mycena polygramma]